MKFQFFDLDYFKLTHYMDLRTMQHPKYKMQWQAASILTLTEKSPYFYRHCVISYYFLIDIVYHIKILEFFIKIIFDFKHNTSSSFTCKNFYL